jgi:hypothetical protein
MAAHVITEIVGLVLLLAVVLSIVAIAIRRSLLTRSGGVDVCWRKSASPDGRGWIFGQGRYGESELVLYRSFSPLPVASKVLRLGIGGVATGGPGPLVGRPGRGYIDVLAELGVLCQDSHAGLSDRQETTVHSDSLHGAVGLGDPRREALAQLGQERGVSGQHADVALDGPRHHHLGRPGPDLSLDGDQFDLHFGHGGGTSSRVDRARVGNG